MGGHGHDHGHHAPYTVPKASIYKIENAKPLLEVQEALARKGLKDPWARNDVWRYDVKQFGTHGSRLTKFLFRGLPLGAALAAGTIALEIALGSPFLTGAHHGHDDHHGSEGHH